jgi:hypothetical protein
MKCSRLIAAAANRDKNITIADHLGWLMSEDRTSGSIIASGAFADLLRSFAPVNNYDFRNCRN